MLRYIIGISILSLGMIIIRALSNGKIRRKHQYAFWIVIPIYMILVPFVKIDVPVSDILNDLFTPKTETAIYEAADDVSPTVMFKNKQNEQVIPDNLSVEDHELQSAPELIDEHEPVTNNYAATNIKTNESKKIESVLVNISYCVSAALIAALIAYNIGFILHCKNNRKYIGRDPASGLRIYSIRNKETPFLLFNKIYVDNNSEKINEYIVCHEACHFKHGDHLWVLIRYLVLFLNWYNPVIWAAFVLSGRDCELACDEEVMKIYGADSSKDYARTLLRMLQQQSNTSAVFTLSTGMRGGYEMMKKRIINIKKPAKLSRKASALSMAAILLVTSCSFVNTSKEVRKIKADDPWFNVNNIEVDTGVEEGKKVRDNPNIQLIGMDDNYYVIKTGGTYELPPDNERDATFNFNDYTYSILGIIDRKTNQTVNSIDLKKDFTASEYTIDGLYYLDGKITLKTNSAERDYDPLTGEILDSRTGNTSNDYKHTTIYEIGNYTVEETMFQTETNFRYCNIKTISPDGKVSDIEIKKEGKSIYIYTVLALSDTKALLPATIGKEKGYYELDLTNNELIEADAKDYEWINGALLSDYVLGSDGMVYFKTRYGFSRINTRLKKIEEVFNYSWCDFNSGVMDRFELVECFEDRFVLFGVNNTSGAYDEKKADKANFIELIKADNNPHAGKTVLELFSPHGVEDKRLSEAILFFNETNDKHFIEYSTRYDINDYYNNSDYDDNNDDVWYMTKLKGSSLFSNKLAIDIMNGDGPDILINTSSFVQINNSNCLADLTPYVKDLDPERYFINIIEGSKIDGKIYQLPISFEIEGIQTKKANAGSSGKGYTYEDYSKFVDEVMNGKDPILYGQATYFSVLFSNIGDEFITNNKVDLSKPEFAELADFVRDNVSEKGTSFNNWYQATLSDGPFPNAVYREDTVGHCRGIRNYYEFASWLGVRYGKGVTMQGIPSPDGRGPRFIPSCSVAVSSQAVDIKACGEFVKILLSEDIQTRYARDDNFVVNREVFKNVGAEVIGFWNNLDVEYTTQDIDFVEKIILSCSRIKYEDSDISIILIEEMPPYFLGQKDLDAVIKIAQDRIQKVLDERG